MFLSAKFRLADCAGKHASRLQLGSANGHLLERIRLELRRQLRRAIHGISRSRGAVVRRRLGGGGLPHGLWRPIAHRALERCSVDRCACRPNGGRPDVFNSVTTTGPVDAWAVGSSAGVSGFQEATLIEHWNGRAWTVVAAPNPGLVWNELDSVVALSKNDVWAVGYYKDDAAPARVLAEHWDGKSWRVVHAPSPGSGWNELANLSASSPTDLWAVGWTQDDGPRQSLVEHWNGITWAQVSINARSVQELRAVVAVSANEAWAVGPMWEDPKYSNGGTGRTGTR